MSAEALKLDKHAREEAKTSSATPSLLNATDQCAERVTTRIRPAAGVIVDCGDALRRLALARRRPKGFMMSPSPQLGPVRFTDASWAAFQPANSFGDRRLLGRTPSGEPG